MTDTPLPLPPTPTTVTVGFLSITTDAGGVLGGYLVTNAWGRPLEFRLTTAVQPNRVQQILYGPTLTESIHADLIGRTLIEKTSVQPALLITDSLPALAIRTRLAIPVFTLQAGEITELPSEILAMTHARCSVPLLMSGRFAEEQAAMVERLDALDPSVDLAEPFVRIREAVAEARKSGGASRAA